MSPTTDQLVNERYSHLLKRDKLRPPIFSLFIYLGVIYVVLQLIGSTLWEYRSNGFFLLFGLLGTWRYGWWAVHHVRSIIYTLFTYPKWKKRAEAAWSKSDKSDKPGKIWYQMTTYFEDEDTTNAVLESIVKESKNLKLPASLVIGIGSDEDKVVINKYFKNNPPPKNFDYHVVKQKNPGKRHAIGAVLRYIKKRNPKRDPIVFMDGDSILGEGSVVKSVQLLADNPTVRGITTNEHVIVNGPAWVRSFLEMRFCIRNVHMRSMALSKKVTALTGRMSVLWADETATDDFINIIEDDHLVHWFWGRFRFLSGDDKSSWYYLLSKGADFLYVPDAIVYTVEQIEENEAKDRVRENLLRWSGNMLRNGSRAIKLGPFRAGAFLWWCLIDQRLSIWTTLIGLAGGFSLLILGQYELFIGYLLWLAITRLCQALALVPYNQKRLDMLFPFLLFYNQAMGALIKLYAGIRLPLQKWSNRQNQNAGFSDYSKFELGFARFRHALTLTAIIFIALLVTGSIRPLEETFLNTVRESIIETLSMLGSSR